MSPRTWWFTKRTKLATNDHTSGAKQRESSTSSDHSNKTYTVQTQSRARSKTTYTFTWNNRCKMPANVWICTFSMKHHTKDHTPLTKLFIYIWIHSFKTCHYIHSQMSTSLYKRIDTIATIRMFVFCSHIHFGRYFYYYCCCWWW